jgi:4-amino-4-deoxy-L-arabinose transferase-like glycosyltransferase
MMGGQGRVAAFWGRGATRPLLIPDLSGCGTVGPSAQMKALIVIPNLPFSIKPLHAILLVLVAWAAIYLPGLGKRELQGEEARRILPGRTMLQTGDWVLPRSAGEVYNRKPPGINWATAIAMVFTGRMDEKSVRMPSALAMLTLAMVTLVMMRGFLGMEGALLAALIMLTNLGFIERGRLAEIDGLYCALFGMAALSWLGLWWKERPLAAWLLSGWLLGLAFLVKGPPHVWFFYAMVIGVLRQEKKLSELLTWRHGLGLLVFVLTWSWWAYLNAGTNPEKDSSSVWIDQISSRLGAL